ncbi:MAG TPA: gamma-glutamyl-gamma-aminobutyrate hydrolase family protein [Actinomycetes bacterium]|nr:gamma-glutamyl-gamma-aminobutyrate hydrolase family protein [Actinomycetes bacterium]
MRASPRPLVVIPGRFSASASALRYRALVTARALSEAVLAAGGEPLTVQPSAPRGSVSAGEVAERLGFADAVLLPGGGDLHPRRYGQDVASDAVYDVDDEQDAFDLAVASWALEAGIPLLAVCRGLHVVNVALGGELDQDMASPHRHVVHEVTTEPGSLLHAVVGPSVTASCYHHQRVTALGTGLRASGRAEDGTLEAAELDAARGWFLGVQWHPEDSWERDPAQRAVLAALVDAARRRPPT